MHSTAEGTVGSCRTKPRMRIYAAMARVTPDATHPSAASPPGHLGLPALAGNNASSVRSSANRIASPPTAPGQHGPPVSIGAPGSWPRSFAKKIPLNRQLADLLEQRCQLCLARRRIVLPIGRSPGEKRRHALQQRLPPRMDLARVHTKPARQLGHGAFLTHRRQRHLRLELSTMLLARIPHVSPPANRPLQGETLS